MKSLDHSTSRDHVALLAMIVDDSPSDAVGRTSVYVPNLPDRSFPRIGPLPLARTTGTGGTTDV